MRNVVKYRKNLDEAIRELKLAVTYAEDGAPGGAAVCAKQAIKLLEVAIDAKTAAFSVRPTHGPIASGNAG